MSENRDLISCYKALSCNKIDRFKQFVPDKIDPNTYFDTNQIPDLPIQKYPVPLISLAVIYDSILCLQYLIKLDADVNFIAPNKNTLLITAAKFNNVNAAKVLISQNVIDVNAKGKKDHTALSYAAKNGNVDMIRLLLSIPGIDIECKNYIGTTPILYAAIGCCLPAVKILVEAGADVTNENDEHFAISNVASISGNADIIEYLMQFDNVDFNHKDCEGGTALYNACRFNHTKVVQLLLSNRKVDVNAKCKNDYTPLHIAAERDALESINLLFTRRDLDVNAKDIYGKTPLHIATENQHPQSVFKLLTHPSILPNEVDNNCRSAFSIALSAHNFTLISMFVSDPEIALDVDRLKDSDLLQNFASKSNIEAVLGLVMRGFAPDRIDQHGRTALTIALGNGDVEMVRQLLATRLVDINRKYRNGESLLHLSVLNQKAAACLRLIMLYPEIDLNATDSKGNTALHLAACTQTQLAVDILLSEPKIEKNILNSEGLTPLHLAVLTGDAKIVDLFLDCNQVDVNVLTPKGNNVLTLSLIENKYDIISIIIDRPEIDVNTFIKGRGTILGAAVIDGQIDLVKKLLNNEKTRISNVGPILFFNFCL